LAVARPGGPTPNGSRPILLVDVDGVISLFGFERADPPAGRWANIDGVLHLLSASAGGHLAALARDFDLVWCTGWEEKASEYLPALIGAPQAIAHLTFEPGDPGDSRDVSDGRWKLAAIDAWAGRDRPLAWIDDRLGATVQQWALARPGATLLVTTCSAVGITGEHVQQLRAWARNHSR